MLSHEKWSGRSCSPVAQLQDCPNQCILAALDGATSFGAWHQMMRRQAKEIKARFCVREQLVLGRPGPLGERALSFSTNTEQAWQEARRGERKVPGRTIRDEKELQIRQLELQQKLLEMIGACDGEYQISSSIAPAPPYPPPKIPQMEKPVSPSKN